ncbi:hypothetical protein RN001_008626 [Aquatica leii]|uniref:Uncharacterized protein n=1 Tax=Aquatica leii TaxID=1421715 RepID=A0AAN7P4H7_9COLE|nr:hypothetical protein RN001_008626 [Aquatica leii]
MKTVFVLCALLGFVLAAPQHPDAQAAIVRSENENIGVGDYKFGFETSNGISRDEQGTLKNPGSENAAMEVHGQSAYTDLTGKKIDVEPDQERPRSSDRKPKKNVEGAAEILKYTNENNGFEGYLFGYETSNGISRNEQLTFRDIDEENRVADIQGGYEFVDPLGRRVVVTYTAGVEGFKPIIHYF